jgi:phosphatidylglycerophosphatase C
MVPTRGWCYETPVVDDVVSKEAAAVRASEPCSAVVVFDFDGTLVSRDSFLDFAFRYCARRPARFLAVAVVLPLALIMKLRSTRAAASVLLWAMTVGSSTRNFVLALRQYAKGTLPDYAREAIFAELARHLRAGSRVVIATGSLPLLVRGLLSARSFGRLPVVGSRFRHKWGGLVTETHCTGRVKVRELQRKFGIVEWATVYTDSFADRSLLSCARDITLVSPSSRTLVRTQRLIGNTAVLRVLHPR